MKLVIEGEKATGGKIFQCECGCVFEADYGSYDFVGNLDISGFTVDVYRSYCPSCNNSAILITA